MKLTEKEKAICREYSQYDETGHVRCGECPLEVDARYCICYANIDGRTREARELKRYE